MKKTILITLLACSALLGSGIEWVKDYKSAIYTAAAEKKPLMFIVSSHHCRYCVMLEKETLSDAEVIKTLNSDFVAAIAYTDAGDLFPDGLRTGATPSIWFLEPSGEPMFQPVRGALGVADFREALSIVTQEWKKRSSQRNAEAKAANTDTKTADAKSEPQNEAAAK